MSRFTRIGAIVVGAAFFLASTQHLPALAQRMANDYFAVGSRDEQLLRDNEKHHLQPGIALLRSGKPNDLLYAKQEFDYMLNNWPNHPQALQLQANALLRLGQATLIDGYFERAYKVSPDVAQLHVTHGVVLLQQNRVEAAIQQLQRGVELDDDSMNGHYNLGLALVRTKQFDEANRHAQRAYALGHPLPGLREQLQRAKAWKPETGSAPAERDKKTQ